MRKLIFILLFTLIPTTAHADCTTKVCVDVYVKDGQVVIEGKKNGSTATARPRIAATTKPKPRPTATRKYTYRPRTSAPTKKSTPSLADKVLQSLPTLQVAYNPAGKVLTKVPVVFYTDLPTFFNKDYNILGVKVSINLKPKSVWSFGDGFVLVTDKVGKPYPSTEITHSYSAPGTYAVVVATYWDGSYTIAGESKTFAKAIKQITTVDVKVVGASTSFVGK